MNIEGSQFSEKTELPSDSIEGKNLHALKDFMDKIGYNYERHDGRSGYIFNPKDKKGIDIQLFGGMVNVMKNNKLSKSDFTKEVFHSLRQYSYDDIKNFLKENGVDFVDETILRDLILPKQDYLMKNYDKIKPFIVHHKDLTSEGNRILRDLISNAVFNKLGITLRSQHKFKGNADGTITIDCSRNIHQDDRYFETFFGKTITIREKGFKIDFE